MRTGVILIAAVLVAGTGEWAPTSGAASGCSSTQVAAGQWSAVDVPPTPSLPTGAAASIMSTTVVGRDRSVVLATDGVAVYRSTDGGCHWRTTYTVGAADYYSDNGFAAAYAVTDIASGHSAVPASRQDVYLALSPTPLEVATVFAAAPPEVIVASHDGGQTFTPVPSTPTVASPVVPECQGPPHLVQVSPTDSRTIYLQCTGGSAQDQADAERAGNAYFAYRSNDGGQTWSLVPLPLYIDDGEWFQLGPAAKEIWTAGAPNNYPTVWHSVDDGAHWTSYNPIGRHSLGSNSYTLAVDLSSRAPTERVVLYASNGAFVTTDTGRHWNALRGTEPAYHVQPMLAFFLRHSVYVIAATSFHTCTSDPVVLRYADTRGKPVKAPFPTTWGMYTGWGHGGSVATIGSTDAAFGLATFCAPATKASSPAKLLTLRPS